MRLEGSLEAFSLPEILPLLTGTKKSGGLHLFRGPQRGIIWLAEGAVCGASSDTTRQSLVRRLVGAGQPTDEALAAAVDRVRSDPAVGLARALREAGAVEDQVLLDLAREHTVDALFDLLRWTDGTFSFEVDQGDPDDLGLRQSMDELVATAGQRVDAWPALSAQASSADVVVRVVVAPGHDPILTGEEWALVALVDGRRSIRDLVALRGRGEYALVALLGPLVDRGLLEVCGAGSGDDAGSAAARRQELIESLEGGGSGTQPLATEATPATVPVPRDPEPEFRPEPDLLPEPQFRPEPLLARGAASSVLPDPPQWPEEAMPAARPRLLGHRRAADSGLAPVPADGQLSIEPDPNVNQGILLRLVAGVRAV